MNILISALRFIPGRTFGAEVYLRALLPACVRNKGDDRLIVAVASDFLDWARECCPAIEVASVRIPRSTIGRIVAEQVLLDRVACRQNADVVFFPFNMAAPTSRPSILMVQDCAAKFYLERFPHEDRIYLWAQWTMLRMGIRSVDGIITSSSAIAREVEQLRLRSPLRMCSIPFAPVAPSGNLGRLHSEETVILQTGCHRPHKNASMGIRSLAELKSFDPSVYAKVRWVLTGVDPLQLDRLRRLAEALGVLDKVELNTAVPREVLDQYVGRASVLFFPTLYEGFGLGVIEAQARGRAVVASDLPVLREVSGQLGEFFDPEAPKSAAMAVLRVLRDETRRIELESRGRDWAARWTWDDHASKLLAVLRGAATAP